MKYRPTEYVVDFGDYRSDNFARLNIALIKSNGAKLNESIVRCRDCINYTIDELGDYCTLMDFEDVKSTWASIRKIMMTNMNGNKSSCIIDIKLRGVICQVI